MKKYLLSMMALMATLCIQAQDWNFASVTDEDVALLEADENWYHDTSSSNNRYELRADITAQPLTANGQELEYAQGLLFTSTVASSGSGNLRIDIKNKRFWVGSTSNKIIIPNVAAGMQITVIGKTSKTDTARGMDISDNVTPTEGYFGQTSVDQVTNKGLVETAGDVEISFTGGM